MKKLKPIGLPTLLGFLIIGIMAVVMLKITIDFQIVLLLTSFLIFMSGLISANRKIAGWALAMFIAIPFTLFFSIVIYSEIPQLIWFAPFFIVAGWLGVSLRRKQNIKGYAVLIIYLMAISYMAIKQVPTLLENQLSQTKNEKVEPFTIIDMEGKEVLSTDLKGKVVVLDFFGTWCRPCVQELVELDKVYSEFSEDDDVVFFVINTAEVGDTIEKMNKFIAKHDYPFNFAFDINQDLVKQFDLHGVPYLFVFDKEGNHRFEHIGYNRGETKFVSSVTKVIQELR